MNQILTILVYNEKIELILKKIFYKFPFLRKKLSILRGRLFSNDPMRQYSIDNKQLLDTFKDDIESRKKALL